ncbi:MAG: uracil-DNA glycosylase [Desulfurivibrio sp.]|nr:uracil-DNA glycosylase [Desulfurivibrio sp.]
MSPEKTSKRPYCFSCRYFYITHEQNTPYGCRALGFKSAQNPALVVAKSSEMECQLFAPKEQGER